MTCLCTGVRNVESSRADAYLHDALTPHLLEGLERSLQSQQRLAKVPQPLLCAIHDFTALSVSYCDRHNSWLLPFIHTPAKSMHAIIGISVPSSVKPWSAMVFSNREDTIGLQGPHAACLQDLCFTY